MTIKKLFATAPVTLILLISFIGLFVAQILLGVDINNPASDTLIAWGANFLPMTLQDDPWRLISSGFLHIGLMHLLFNGFAIYFFGQVAEPIFGSAKFLVLFVLAVIGGNLLNNQMTWLGILDGVGPGLSAGASGGIMGIGAALLMASLFKMSVNGLRLNLKSLLMIMGINLVYGFAVPGIDNAGHIGGAITGLLFALPIALAYRHRQGVQARQRLQHYARAQQGLARAEHISAELPLTDIFASGAQASVRPTDSTTPPHSTTTATAHSVHSVHVADTVPPAPIASGAAASSAEMSRLWQILPWLTIALIAIGFVCWWLYLHDQLLQALAALA